MANSIFSTYSTPENRVTSTILAVFEKINSTTVTRILQVLMEDSTIELIEYENQVKATDSDKGTF
jgi:F0F1-type ATP synthase delta subunit